MKKSIPFLFGYFIAAISIASVGYIWSTDACITDACSLERRERIEDGIKQKWNKIGTNIIQKENLSEKMNDEFSSLSNNYRNIRLNSLRLRIKWMRDRCRYWVSFERDAECDRIWRSGDSIEREITSILNHREMIILEINKIKNEAIQLRRLYEVTKVPDQPSDLSGLYKSINDFDKNFVRVMNFIGSSSPDIKEKTELYGESMNFMTKEIIASGSKIESLLMQGNE